MNLARLSSICTLTFVFMLTGCAPPTTGTKGNISITVNPVGPTDWGYKITTTGSANITKVVFTLTVSGCSVKSKPQGWRDGPVPGGIQVEEASGKTTVDITLECDANDGPIYVDAHVLGGAPVTVGPISGPT